MFQFTDQTLLYGVGLSVVVVVSFFLMFRIAVLRERDVWIDAGKKPLPSKDVVEVGKHKFVVLTEQEYLALVQIVPVS